MKAHLLFRLLGYGLLEMGIAGFPLGLAAQEKATEEKKEAPLLKIERFQHTVIADWHYNLPNGKTAPVKCFKLAFKVLDDSINSLDLHRVYFFNDKKELIHTVTHIDSKGKEMQGISNLLVQPSNLKKGTTYTILLTYPGDEVKWKYAVGVIGSGKQVVAETLPHDCKIEGFNFPDKDKILSSP